MYVDLIDVDIPHHPQFHIADVDFHRLAQRSCVQFLHCRPGLLCCEAIVQTSVLLCSVHKSRFLCVRRIVFDAFSAPQEDHFSQGHHGVTSRMPGVSKPTSRRALGPEEHYRRIQVTFFGTLYPTISSFIFSIQIIFKCSQIQFVDRFKFSRVFMRTRVRQGSLV